MILRQKLFFLLIAGLATTSLSLMAVKGIAQEHDSASHSQGDDNQHMMNQDTQHHMTTEQSPLQAGEDDLVDVSDEGTRYDPPVNAAHVPTGSWYCDMNGSVHYASHQQGDGSCPVCGMFLVQRADGETPTDTHAHSQSQGQHH